MNKTIEYYNINAGSYAVDTINADITATQDRFLSLLPKGGRILDFGCGSGRDTKYFLSQGFIVEATDGSEALCKIARENTGIDVKQMLFSELNETNWYDGIWACSSILHLRNDELRDVFYKMIRSLKIGGYLYTSFKYGSFEGLRGERYFTDFTEYSFKVFIADMPELSLLEMWISNDVRPGRGEEQWLNLILRKTQEI